MIRVLHIFAPTFGRTFSGDVKLWVRSFQKWVGEKVSHQILLIDSGDIVAARAINSAFGEKGSSGPITLPRWRRALWAFKLLWLLVSKRHGYDIIHVHTDYWGGLLVGPLGKFLRRPSVFQVVRMGEDDPTTLTKESFGSIKLWCFKRFDQILCISEALRQECLRQGFDSNKVPMLINAVHTDVFSPIIENHDLLALRRKLNLAEDARVVLSIGSVIPRKGTDLLVDAFLSLAKDHPNLCLILVGPASRTESTSVDEIFVTRLQRKVTDAGLEKRVIFAGRIDDDVRLAEYYRAADIFALPTHQEGLPNVLLEAMSASLPIVATDLPGSTDLIIEDGKTGFLIPPSDVPALKEKLQWMLDHLYQAQKMGRAAHIHAVESFGFHTWQKNLSAIYFLLFNQRSPEDC